MPILLYRVINLPSRFAKPPNARAAAGAFLAAALTFAVVVSAVPLGSVFSAQGCSMPCCKGADGMPGDCKGGSCPISHSGKAKTKTKPAKPAHSDPSCHAGDITQSHDGATGMHHSMPEHASSHEQDSDGVEHSSHQHVSPQNTSTELALTSTALAKPCPSDCGGILNASTQLRRSREEAALSDKFQPRPSDTEVRTQDPVGAAKISFALRRQYPPRAPPTCSTIRPA